MDSIAKLREERARVWETMKSCLERAEKREDGQPGLTGENLETYNRAEAALDGLTVEIEKRERASAIRKTLEAPVTDEDRTAALSAPGAPGAPQNPEARYAGAFDAYLRRGFAELAGEQRSALREGFTESRDIGVATGSAGGYLVPQGFLVKLTEVLKYFGPMRQLANRIETQSGNAMPWPNNDDTGNVGSILGENVAISALDTTLSTKTLNAYMYTSGLVKASWQLLNDSAFDVESFLTRKLGQRIGRIQNTHFTTGTGTNQPQGIVPTGGAGTGDVVLPTGNTTTLTYNGIIDLVHALNYAYRQSKTVAFQMSDKALAAARKIVDSQSRPIWTPGGLYSGLAFGSPDTLAGYPVYVNSDMAVPAANAFTVGFGDWNAFYILRDVLGFQMIRLDERFADQLQVGFFGFARTDGRIDDTASAKFLQHSAT